MKKALSLILICLILLVSFCGCKNKEDESNDPNIVPNVSNSSEGTLKLAYSKADMLDPFTASMTANIQILALAYDGLYKLDKSYNSIPSIAKNSVIGETTVNVTLNSVNFSDGSPITAADVVYSFEKSRLSPAFGSRLENIAGASVSTSNMLVFTLREPDPYVLSCLTFPIVKSGSSGELPIGSGRYTPQKSGESVYLVVNSDKQGFNPAIKTIMLVPVRDITSLESSLEIGNTGFFYNDLSDGTYSRINAKTVEMGINNLVYLGFNSQSEIFSNASMRQAVNLAINRKEITSVAFQGHARETYSPFNPDWYALKSKNLIVSSNTQKALELIAESEIDIENTQISLLVNKDNQFKLETANFVESYLTSLGFKVLLKDYTEEYYTEALELGSFDIYIGEIRLSPNMNLNAIFDGTASFGIDPLCAAAERYSRLLSGKCELMDFINTFNEDLPFVPVCYRNAAASYTNAMQADFNCCDADVFYDIETWHFK